MAFHESTVVVAHSYQVVDGIVGGLTGNQVVNVESVHWVQNCRPKLINPGFTVSKPFQMENQDVR